jgi:hypothetical protein
MLLQHVTWAVLDLVRPAGLPTETVSMIGLYVVLAEQVKVPNFSQPVTQISLSTLRSGGPYTRVR